MQNPKNFDSYVKLANKTVKISLLSFVTIGVLYFLVLSTDSFIKISLNTSDIPADVLVTTEETPKEIDYFAKYFDVNQLGTSKQDSMIKYGYELIAKTFDYIGSKNGNPKMVFTGNNLACKSCHLDAGTKAGAGPYVGVTSRYPQFRGRENKVGSIEERVNGCMTRSMNGKPLPENGKEMRAIVAYMTWLGTGVPGGEKINGSGFGKMNLPERAVDLAQGEAVFKANCVVCHQADAQGMPSPDGRGYTYPPLAGNDSYNHGAGMHRVITAAQFIKYNMPLGATLNEPVLSDEEAYDVAGYINSLARPQKANTEQDFPDKKLKPMSTAYGPWADDFSAEQHKYGPFQPIFDFYKKEFNIEKKN